MNLHKRAYKIRHLYVGIVIIKHAGEIKLKLNQFCLPPSLVYPICASVYIFVKFLSGVFCWCLFSPLPSLGEHILIP